MKTRIIVSAVLLPIFFAVLFFFPPYILTGVVSLICAIAAYELLHATGSNKNKRILIYTIITAALVPASAYLKTLPAIIFNFQFSIFNLALLFILTCLLFIEAILAYKTERQISLQHILIALFGGIVIPYMLSALINLRIKPEGHLFVLLPIICAFMTDSGAYFTGVALGKRKAFPNISPGKTIEGCIGGMITGAAGMIIYGIILANTTPHTIIFPALVLYGIIGAAVTQLGDLVFSLIKREYDVKDYGRLIPGHGGMLDRFDSMTFTAPAMYLLLSAYPAIIV